VEHAVARHTRHLTPDTKKAGIAGLFLAIRDPQVANHERYAGSAMSPLSFLIAFASIWRMRSAETLYRLASSCSVAFSSVIQRLSKMSRLRSSSVSIA